MPKKKTKPPLSKTHPKLAKEADGWDPKIITAGSKKKVNWKCSKGHKFEAAIYNRIRGNRICPKCSSGKPNILKGSLSERYPLIAKEADGWDPKEIGAGTNIKKPWKCLKGHTWVSAINSRTQGRGCPYCSNNKVWPGFNDIATTHPIIAKTIYGSDPREIIAGSEKKVNWICNLGHIYSLEPKKRIGRSYGCPFCSNSKLLIGFNDFKTRHPEIAMEADGWDPFTVIGGSAVFRNWKCQLGHKYSAKVSSRDSRNSGCPYCANQKVLKGFNDLATTHPELAIQADGWDPSKVIASKKSVKWICSKGHKSKASINVRKSGSGCRICTNQQVLFGYNDLQTKFASIASEASGWDPKKVIAGSNQHKIWKCSEGHKWKATIASRTGLQAGCPTCAPGGGFDPNDSGYLYFLIHKHWEMYQIGITNVPDRRLHQHKNLGWEVTELRGPMDGHLTKEWETAILRMLKAKGADLANKEIAGKFDGYSEAWSKSTFPVKSIKELMRLTEEFEDSLK